MQKDVSPIHQSKKRITARYIFLQLPGLVAFALILVLLRELGLISSFFLWSLIVVWVAKDIVLFPFLWRFYDFDGHPDRFGMTGLEGVAATALEPEGFVRVKGELWQAVAADDLKKISKGDAVIIISANGLRLEVRPCSCPQGES